MFIQNLLKSLPLQYHFAKAGITIPIFLPPLVSFFLSLVSGVGGVSGAFLLLPFQVSILNYTAPSVSATNHLFNCVAIPWGVYKYWREGRLYTPLTLIISLGTLPGVIIGYFLRVSYFLELKNFLLLVGLVLLIIGGKLFFDLIFPPKKEATFSYVPPKTLVFSVTKLSFEYSGRTYEVSSILIFLIACVIGIVGGIYGIGGGAIMAPVLLAFFHLPAYVFAGATLFATFLTSVIGVIVYTTFGNGPDFLLGLLFGIGGGLGLYLSAKLQRYFPQKVIRGFLGIILIYIAIRYILRFFE
jgi:uncharacterized membrane protein YfcA